MKKLFSIGIWVLICGCQNNSDLPIVGKQTDFDKYSITLSFDYTTVYFRLEEKNDSMLIIKQRYNDTLRQQRMVFFTKDERAEFSQLVMHHLKPEIIKVDRANVNEGGSVSFLASSGNCKLSAAYHNILNSNSVSDNLYSYLIKLKDERIEIDTFALHSLNFGPDEAGTKH